MQDRTDQIIEYIKQNPFCTNKKIARYFDINRNAVLYHIKKIREMRIGLIRSPKAGKTKPSYTYRIMNQRKVK